MSLVTRQYGPDAKGEKLTSLDMDNNLYYLQSIGVSGFSFSSNTITITNPTGGTESVLINNLTGLTINGDLTVTGNTNINSISATTISATTYQNLPTDIRVTGGTYNGSTITFTNNTGGTFTVTGVTSSTTFTGGTVTGSTNFTNGLTANTISATTYQNLPLDIRVTGGTYSSGLATFTNNTGGTFSVSGFSTGSTFTGGAVSGSTQFTNGLTANTISATTYQNLPLDIRVTGGTYSAGTITLLNNTGGTVSISGLSTGYTYSQTNNYTSGIPITITHNLNTTEILIQIIDTNTNQLILGSVSNYQLNSVDVTLSSSLNGIKVVIVGGSVSSVTPRGKINLLFGHDSVNPLDSTTYYIGGQFNLAPTTSASDGRRLISPVTGYITQVSISETVSGTLGSSEPSTFTIENVTQSTSSTITTTATYDSSSSLQNYILSSPLYVVNGDRLEIRWITPVWGPNPTTVRQQINVLIDF